ncbi:EAL domain-containing protein [Devosia sp.]|uniref:putative bifunctional diguanylate cyclase/phosphodiesterase n=1 Tax=Devosia sp. TaxID=1871048 RepID=UPI00261131E2|nr:EAL domain-containing protein [Devosia sp.]
MTSETSELRDGWAAKFWRFVVRHRVSIQDLGMLLAVLLVGAFIAFESDLFLNEQGISEKQAVIELDETLLLGGMLTLGLLVFGARRYLDQKREIKRRTAAEQQARTLAYQDPLTGLANRRQFEEALNVAIAATPAAGKTHAVLMLDLNGFKQVNDVYGHGVGDEVLTIVGQRLLRAARQGDLVARLGGDEFIILAQHLIGPEAAGSIALRIIQALAEPVVTGSLRHAIGAGIGVALIPSDATSKAEAMRTADVALYRAKAERRSAFRFFERDMDRLVHEREQLERELRGALAADQIVAQFRPSLGLRSGKIIGYEAIPSWQAVDGSAVAPERFMAVAEDTGLIHEVARRVLERACLAAMSWPQHVSLSVDIFPGQLQDPQLWKSMLATLEAVGFDPRRLTIEITEAMIVHDLEAAKLALSPLRDAGVSIALDNFGTGYSSLYHMQAFKLDKVKIDRSFLENIGDAEAAKVVKALAGLGRGLGLKVSADNLGGVGGVAMLLDSGIEEAQSSGRLMSADEARVYWLGQGPAPETHPAGRRSA